MCTRPKEIGIVNRFGDYEKIKVACGKCDECLVAYNREWTQRICDEAKYYTENCCITLTYAVNPETLVKRDYQLFLKLLRKHIFNTEMKRIRFFISGEYGTERGRPHYHCIIFGWRPRDLVFFFERNGERYYKSATVEKLWQRGNILVGDVSEQTARYTANYMQKLLFRDKRKEKQWHDAWEFGSVKEKYSFQLPFVEMSTRPGIGYKAVKETMLIDDKVYNKHGYMKLPRYYVNVLAKEYGDDIVDEAIRLPRKRLAESNSEDVGKLKEREKNLRAKLLKQVVKKA